MKTKLKYCPNCGNELSEKRGDAKFCCKECQNKYHYKLRTGQLKGIGGFKEPNEENENTLERSLRGVIEPEGNPEEPAKKEYEAPYKNQPLNIDAVFFSDLLNQKEFNVDNKLELSFDNLNGQDQHETEPDKLEDVQDPKKPSQQNPLPEKYISKEKKVENGLYLINKNHLKKFESSKQSLEQEYKKLEADLKFQQSRSGNGIIAVSGIGAGLYGFLDIPEKDLQIPTEGEMTLRDRKGKIILKSKKNKPKKKTTPKAEIPSFLERIGKALLYGAIGTGAGLATKAVTEDWRENDKQEKIDTIKKRMAAINQEYQKLNIAISNTKNFLSGSSQYLIKTEQVLNPDYEKALNGLSNKETNQAQKFQSGFKQTEPIKFKSDKIIKATDLAKIDYKALKFAGLWNEFFGLPSVNFHLLVHGNSGEGKSTFCMWFARYLAENFGRVLYVSGEEGLNKTFHDKLVFCKAEVNNLHILDVRTGNEFMKEVGVNEFHFIILDSLHDMDIDSKKLKEIFEKYKNTAFICIDQNNKKGELLGANEKKHLQDIVVNVKDYVAETTKNRFEQKGKAFNTSDFTNDK